MSHLKDAVFPKFVRRAASTRARYKRQGRCHECGAGWWDDKGQAVLQAHEPSCPVLAKIVETEKRGICTGCGRKKTRREGWDQRMQCVAVEERCPNGCSYNMSWRLPTDADIQAFGLVRKPKRARRIT